MISILVIKIVPMKKLNAPLLFVASICLIILSGCSTSSSVSKTDDAAMSAAGFVAGEIVFQKEEKEPCNFLVKLEDGTLLEPTGIDKTFMNNGLRVWIQYLPSRRMSLCPGSMTVSVTEIQKRS